MTLRPELPRAIRDAWRIVNGWEAAAGCDSTPPPPKSHEELADEYLEDRLRTTMERGRMEREAAERYFDGEAEYQMRTSWEIGRMEREAAERELDEMEAARYRAAYPSAESSTTDPPRT